MPLNREEALELAALAREAGDDDAELEALEAIESLGVDGPAPEPSAIDVLGGAAAQINQGLTFGLSDELAGGLAAVNPAQMGSGYFEQMGERYSGARDAARELQSGFSERNPVTAMGLETTGALATGLASAPKLMSMTGLSTMPIASKEALGTGAKLGALEGATYGYGIGEGEGDTLEKMAGGAAIGALAAPAMDIGMKGVGALDDAIMSRIGRTAEDKAKTIVAKTLGYDELGPESASEALEKLGPEGILADLGPNARAITDVVASDAGPARKKALAVLESRQMGQQKRIMSAAEESLGAQPGDFGGSVRQMSMERFEKAQPLYQEAFDTPIEMTPDMARLFDRPSVRSAMGDVEDIAHEEGVLFGGIDWGNPTTQQVDILKKSLDRQIGIKQRSGDADARRITKTKNEILNIVDEQNPVYEAARSSWESDSKAMDAADLGRRILKDDAEETGYLVGQMGQTERDAYTMGAIKAVEDAVQGAGDTHNAMRRIVGNPKLRGRLRNAFESDEQFDSFMRTMESEGVFSETRAGVGKGSQTSIREQARKSMGLTGEGDGVLEMAADATISPAYSATKGFKSLLRRSTIDPDVGASVADIMTSGALSEEAMQQIFLGGGSVKRAGVPEALGRLERLVPPRIY